MKCNTTDEGGRRGTKGGRKANIHSLPTFTHTNRRRYTIRSNTGIETQIYRNTCLVSWQVWSKVVDPKNCLVIADTAEKFSSSPIAE
jgi:hypothetical protein